MKQPKVEFSTELDEAVRDLDKSPTFVAQCLKYDIGTLVLKALEEEGMSRADLAKELGKSRQYVTKMLKAETNFTLESIAALSVALGRDFQFAFAKRGAIVRIADWQKLDGGKGLNTAMIVQAPSDHRVLAEAFSGGEYADDAAVAASKSPALATEAM